MGEKPSSHKTQPGASPTVTRSWGQFSLSRKRSRYGAAFLLITAQKERKKQKRKNEKHQTQKTITSARQRQFRLQNCQTRKDFEFQLQRETETEWEREWKREGKGSCSSFQFSFVRFGLISRDSSTARPMSRAHPSALSLRFWEQQTQPQNMHRRARTRCHAHTTDHHKS